VVMRVILSGRMSSGVRTTRKDNRTLSGDVLVV